VNALRIEDIDSARTVRGSQLRIEDDLRWLGLVWDEGPVLQSERGALYESAIGKLAAAGLVYPCDCSRAELARVASAPHPGEETVYPGFCRKRDPGRPMRRPPALRVQTPDEVIEYEDGIRGRVAQNLARAVGDFVVRRGDGVFAYQLAVAVDDAAMCVTDVVRGEDLIASTPRQIWLMRFLGSPPPRYLHVPIVVDEKGARLEKRTRGATVGELRARGTSPERIIGALAHGIGLARSRASATAAEIADECAGRSIRWRRDAWPIPTTW
jgi:glutamyl-tRNA synthetase